MNRSGDQWVVHASPDAGSVATQTAHHGGPVIEVYPAEQGIFGLEFQEEAGERYHEIQIPAEIVAEALRRGGWTVTAPGGQ